MLVLAPMTRAGLIPYRVLCEVFIVSANLNTFQSRTHLVILIYLHHTQLIVASIGDIENIVRQYIIHPNMLLLDVFSLCKIVIEIADTMHT